MKHEATTSWRLEGDMPSGRYSRAYETRFDGGAVVAGAPSPDIVPPPWTDVTAVDPEEMFVAAISSCHMLWFLDYARRAKLTVLTYDDPAVGVMTKNDAGALWVSKVTLSPTIVWDGEAPDATAIAALHDKAHHACFIANSTKTEIVVKTI
jgi:organic hydroperoxide reductase OsmC/OhrA